MIYCQKAERGFVSQKRDEAKELRAQSREARAAEMHFYRVETAKAGFQASKRNPNSKIPVSEPSEAAQTAA